MTLVTPDSVSNAALLQAWKAHLELAGVGFPAVGTQQYELLSILYANKGVPVYLEELREITGISDPQPRHLRYQGWWLLLSGKSRDTILEPLVFNEVLLPVGSLTPRGTVILHSVTAPVPDFKPDKRKNKLTTTDWDSLQNQYGYRCAMCGSAKPPEKGHLDPTKALTLDNTIPLCSNCNNWASDDVVLDKNGRVAAVASSRLVLKASHDVQLAILSELTKLHTPKTPTPPEKENENADIPPQEEPQ